MASDKMVKGALLLTLAGLISKVLSAGYRIPLQNLTGDVGFYVYQQVYPILGIALVLGLYGFPSAISKITVDLKGNGNNLSFRNFYLPVLLILIGINLALFLFLRLNADSIAVWVGDRHLTNTYKMAAFVFLLLPFSVLLRGVFQGEFFMVPTALSQIGEQLFRVGIIIGAAYLVATQGLNIYEIGKAGGVAGLIGVCGSIFILFLFFIKYKPVSNDNYPIPWNYYMRTILTFGVVASMNHMILLLLQFADSFTLIPSLVEYGLTSYQAMETKGVYDRGQPLIQLGTVLGSSFALALIPAITQRNLKADRDAFYKRVQSSVVFSFYIAAGATIGLIIIFPEANVLLFQNDEGTATLRVLVVAIVLSSISITALSILQGLGYIKRTAGFILGALFIKWIGNQLLVPTLGVTGAALATVFSLLALCTIALFELKRKHQGLTMFKKVQWKSFLIAASSMIGFLLLMELITGGRLSFSRVGLLVYIVSIVVIGGGIYISLLIRFGAFTEKELAMLPFASKLTRLQRRK
ncbi:polysaccharide transporter, PST family [Oceanobacillus limi]|uniref:Polysaccharide transporter, PST family n=1 Tax=Oceanobacillus limi TaxID=930131 RepID=A0A1I0H532_9BACI|nr:polysaccharide biosynthesis protein [Oceanobacillus limi]SET78744.1 polysaccharide transporter, PST family [Oceanobacillus limi]